MLLLPGKQPHTHTHTHTPTYTHTHTHIHIHTYIHTCIHTYIHTYTVLCKNMRRSIKTCTHYKFTGLHGIEGGHVTGIEEAVLKATCEMYNYVQYRKNLIYTFHLISSLTSSTERVMYKHISLYKYYCFPFSYNVHHAAYYYG